MFLLKILSSLDSSSDFCALTCNDANKRTPNIILIDVYYINEVWLFDGFLFKIRQTFQIKNSPFHDPS